MFYILNCVIIFLTLLSNAHAQGPDPRRAQEYNRRGAKLPARSDQFAGDKAKFDKDLDKAIQNSIKTAIEEEIKRKPSEFKEIIVGVSSPLTQGAQDFLEKIILQTPSFNDEGVNNNPLMRRGWTGKETLSFKELQEKEYLLFGENSLAQKNGQEECVFRFRVEGEFSKAPLDLFFFPPSQALYIDLQGERSQNKLWFGDETTTEFIKNKLGNPPTVNSVYLINMCMMLPGN
jgi:hypothetical protein